PQLPDNIPSFYVKLMRQCWDAEPSIRPSAEEITRTIYKWINKPTSDVESELEAAEAMRFNQNKSSPQLSLKINPQAIYTSRSLPTIKTDLF
ncbi:25531_t:CDS:1, partial [Racocetra persica]